MSNDHSFGTAEFHYRAQHVEGDKFRDGWDRIFGKKTSAPTPPPEETPATRYFTDDVCVWKFAPGENPQTRHISQSKWVRSIYGCLDEFMACPACPREITAEEGEP